MRNACAPSPSNDMTASTICSTTRGPAIWPSLVTCPTSMIAAPLALAKRISACADPRTWLTVPGADSIAPLHIVWIESITTSLGLSPELRVATMSSTPVCAANCTGAWLRPSRSARSRTCDVDSSPEIYTTRPPFLASAAQAWINKVDLPMPGSPPINATEPGTNPPPATRSSSATPVAIRASARAAPVRSSSAKARPARPLRAMAAPMPALTASSTIVFHSPHDSHLPCQRCVTAPQFWQTNEDLDLLIG